jgi:hypothetical protein
LIKKAFYLNVTSTPPSAIFICKGKWIIIRKIMNQKIVKNLEKLESNEGELHEEFSGSLKNYAGYILITCDQPTESGQMKVEMSYGGSKDLVNMLIDGAQDLLEEAEEEEEVEEEASITEVIPF